MVPRLRWRVATRSYRRTAGDHRKAARPLRRYGGARAAGFATAVLHHALGRDLTWLDRDGSGRSRSAKISGHLRGDKVVFQYAWEGVQCLADFDTRTGRGAARSVGSSEVFAEFTGQSKMPSEDQIELWGGVWIEAGKEYGWKAELGDY